jgi:hypothetical protein
MNREPTEDIVGPIMHIDEILRPPVGADLSRPQPIYRLLSDVPISRFNR